MKKIIFLFIFLCIGLTSGCKKNETPDVPPTPNPDIPSGGEVAKENPVVSLNKERYVVGDEIIINIDNYNNNYSLFNIEFDSTHAVKKIADGKYKARRNGTYNATITLIEDPTKATNVEFTIYSKSFPLDVTTETLTIGDKIDVWIYSFDNLYEKSLDDFIFSINDPLLASMDKNVLTAKACGNVEITATSKYNENVKSKINVTIGDVKDTFMIRPLKEFTTIKVGEILPMEITQGFNPEDFEWLSSNGEIVRVTRYDKRLEVSGVKEGTASFSCFKKDNTAIRAKYTITVKGVEDTDYITRFLDMAYEQVGITENGRNNTKFGIWYNNNGEPWCATFVSWCWYHAGLSNDLLLKYQGCYTGKEWCEEKGIFKYKESYHPKSGDIVFFLSDGWSHTGIVAYADNDYIYTIEGNRSDCVGVWRLNLNHPSITGYAVPNYPKSTERCDYSWIKNKLINGNHIWTPIKGGESTT